MSWPQVQYFALEYQPFLHENFPDYVKEMQGVADGAGVEYSDILALNVRTEIAFGAFSDGCTAFYVDGKDGAVLAQNWDWNTEQAENLICLKIEKENGLRIQMITEAGIIGKVGLNSHGVGCTLNAIKALGISYTKIPCHLALRAVMESKSTAEAVATLGRYGVASSCHILIGDNGSGIGVECSSQDIVLLQMSGRQIVHTNHYLNAHHDSVIEVKDWLPDTIFRLDRIRSLLDEAQVVDVDTAERLLKDERGSNNGAAICRRRGKDGLATLFSIVMDLKNSDARVVMGRPTESGERLLLKP